jgi:HPt (histidine-containing phosphotransfer) domain-containing protein
MNPPHIIKDEMTPAAPTAPSPKAAAPAPAVEVLPVDMDRLHDLTEGNADSIRELVDLFFKQTTQQLAQLEAAVRANKADDVRRVAHSCVGASATLGMTRFVPLLRELEKQGASGTLTGATQLYENAEREFKLIQDFLAAQLNPATPPPAAAHS